VGIAENSLFGIAAGLAMAGLRPVVSTFAVFTSLRSAEQVRTDICYQNLDVKIISTHAGISFGQAGSTHHCTEDGRHAVLRQHDRDGACRTARDGQRLVAPWSCPGRSTSASAGVRATVHRDQDFLQLEGP
jgi:transketolase